MNRVRQLLVMERFLVRVFDRLDGVVLKGGLVMELRLDPARMTRDVDPYSVELIGEMPPRAPL